MGLVSINLPHPEVAFVCFLRKGVRTCVHNRVIQNNLFSLTLSVGANPVIFLVLNNILFKFQNLSGGT